MALALECLHRYCKGYKVITTAPVKRQVANLWSEIRIMKRRAREVQGLIIPGRWAPRAHEAEIDEKWTLRGYTARLASGESVATAFAGEHHTRVFLCMDELVGIPEAIFEAGDRILTGENDKYLGAGNPTEPTSYAAKASKMVDKNGKPVYNVLHMSSEDHPNVVHGIDIIEGATSRKFCEKQLAKGGSRDSAYYRTSVLGLFPNQAEDALIRAEWVVRSKLRSEMRIEDWKESKKRQKWPKDHRGIALGLDVAGEGKDLTVLTGYDSGKLFFPKLKTPGGDTLPCWHRGKDHTHAVDLLIAAIKQIPRVLAVSIDDTGLGASVSADLWRRQKEFPEVSIYITKGPFASPSEIRTKLSVTRINFGASPPKTEGDSFGCMKDVLWYSFREALRLDLVHLPTDLEQREAGFPDDSDYNAQILAPVTWKDSKGKLHVLDKQSAFGGKGREVSKHLPSISPDIGHSMLLARWAGAQLPERSAGPETTEEIFYLQKEAIIAATTPKPENYKSPLRPFQRRAR
jgi:hypothetical protein